MPALAWALLIYSAVEFQLLPLNCTASLCDCESNFLLILLTYSGFQPLLLHVLLLELADANAQLFSCGVALTGSLSSFEIGSPASLLVLCWHCYRRGVLKN